ncbi:MAG: hypothetical protein VB119_04340 [Candidatus Metalachnospira sp.]|nr:hypothetical protein [Candidatus Metalachnospira sp.]
MAQVNIDVAKQATSEEINNKIGNTDDESLVGSVQAKLNALKANNADKSDMKSLSSELKELINGNPTAFGNGVLGEVIYSEDFIYPSKDYYGRYILQFTNFTLPAGVVMTPPEKCNGIYIYCTGTCIINGTIDMRGKRLTLDSDNGISNFVTIGGVNYPLAIGGHTVKGGNGGYSGAFAVSSSKDVSPAYALGGTASNPTAGNINGGGSNNFGYAGIPFNDGELFWKYNRESYYSGLNGVLATTGGVSSYREASGAVILVALSLLISSTGVIDCSASNGVACINTATSATLPVLVCADTAAYLKELEGSCGRGTDGSQAPTGGGCITLITPSFTNNGKLITRGASLTCVGDAVGANVHKSGSDTDADGDHIYLYACTAGGHAGGGGTFISQAGQIIVHVISA